MKKPWQSKTLVINGVLGLAAAVSLFLPAADAVPTFISAHAGEIGMFWGILNIIIRAVTKEQIVLGE